jgi:hypothetical protein
VSKLLPVGAYVLVRDPGCRDGERVILEPREYVGHITGYSVFRDKYKISVHYGRGLWAKSPDYAPTTWCEEITQEQALDTPRRTVPR